MGKEVVRTFEREISIAMAFFLITATYGWILRLYKVVDFIPFGYKDILQAHSHVTFLGWGFFATVALVRRAFYPGSELLARRTHRMYYVMALALTGLLISFPLQGYRFFSILFLSLFLLASYIYLHGVLKNLKKDRGLPARLVRTGIYFYYLSSLGIWALPPVVLELGKGDLYFDTIYFYLHFLYNGFFVFALFGVFLKLLQLGGTRTLEKDWKWFYLMTAAACIPAYALSLLWTAVPDWVYGLAVVSAIVQWAALFYLYRILRKEIRTLSGLLQRVLLLLVSVAYALKVTFQLMSVFPSILAEVMRYKHFFVIGYLHLYTLGFMSLLLLFLVALASERSWSSAGLLLLLFGILVSEAMLFGQGVLLVTGATAIPSFDLVLLLVSAFMPVGIFWMLTGRIRERYTR